MSSAPRPRSGKALFVGSCSAVPCYNGAMRFCQTMGALPCGAGAFPRRKTRHRAAPHHHQRRLGEIVKEELLGYIEDGYTANFHIAGVPNLYPPVRGSFRPMLIEELVTYYKASEKASGLQVRQTVAKLLADHLVSWDMRDAKGNVVPLKAAAMMRLKDRLFQRLFAVVSTAEAPDAEPELPDDEFEAAAADLLKAAESDRSLAEVGEERERKNS
jgi:hypothetical protein